MKDEASGARSNNREHWEGNICWRMYVRLPWGLRSIWRKLHPFPALG